MKELVFMPYLELITSEEQFLEILTRYIKEAESFSFCSPAVDSGGGKWKLWKILEQNLQKLKRAYVAFDGIRSEPDALGVLYRANALRLVPAADGSFRVNLWRFECDGEVRILVGSGTLCPRGVVASADAIVNWSGLSREPFSLQIQRLLKKVETQAHVPDKGELGRYAQSYEQAREHWEELHKLGASYIQLPTGPTPSLLELVERKSQIAGAIKELRNAFAEVVEGTRRQRIGFPGGALNANIYWVPSLSLWASFDKLDNRYRNAFGVDPPDPSRSMAATIEINVPLSGINRRVVGAIGRDPQTDELYLLHRGRLGRGSTNVGADLFWRRFGGGIPLSESDCEEPNQAVVVAQIGTSDQVRDIAAFVHQVVRVKDSVR